MGAVEALLPIYQVFTLFTDTDPIQQSLQLVVKCVVTSSHSVNYLGSDMENVTSVLGRPVQNCIRLNKVVG